MARVRMTCLLNPASCDVASGHVIADLCPPLAIVSFFSLRTCSWKWPVTGCCPSSLRPLTQCPCSSEKPWRSLTSRARTFCRACLWAAHEAASCHGPRVQPAAFARSKTPARRCLGARSAGPPLWLRTTHSSPGKQPVADTHRLASSLAPSARARAPCHFLRCPPHSTRSPAWRSWDEVFRLC